MKTIILLGDYITIETITRWVRAAFTVVFEMDKQVGSEIERTLKVIEAQ